MSEKINVLLIEPGKYPKQIEIEDTLEAMQETVGGYIEEYMPFDDEVAIVCNEEGKMNGAELNRAIYSDDKEILDIIAGKFFIAYAPIESESFLSMPKDLMKKYEDMECDGNNQRSSSGNRTCTVGAVLCGRRCPYLRQLYRCKKAGTRTEIVCSLCHCQRCHNLRYGAYACFIQYRSRYHFNHYDIIGIWNTESDDAPIRNGNNH